MKFDDRPLSLSSPAPVLLVALIEDAYKWLHHPYSLHHRKYKILYLLQKRPSVQMYH